MGASSIPDSSTRFDTLIGFKGVSDTITVHEGGASRIFAEVDSETSEV